MKVDEILANKHRELLIERFNQRAPQAKAIISILLDKDDIPRLVMDGNFSDLLMLERIFHLQLNKDLMHELKGEADEHQ